MSRFDIPVLGAPRRTNPIALRGDIRFVSDDERLLYDPHFSASEGCPSQSEPEGFEVAGPRREIFFDPEHTRAAIVTCGGLCPGINAVIRALVLQLWFIYGCRDILGIRYGYHGLGRAREAPRALTPADVGDIHRQGGTVLGSS
ncbi:MAG TPA: ATP-dependent 6-phosphofructokinase, partial [Chromatiales bacterium]|nr:ATP-dependent 6-phosphofructokinase [Chromatiales bacterium]